MQIRSYLSRRTQGLSLTFALLLMAAQVTYGERAALLIDIGNQSVMLAENALRPSYPASLTKLMTLYLLFEAIEAGEISLTTTLPISATAVAQAPVNLGLRAGQQIEVDDAIDAIIVVSANDVAVVVAEALAGSHELFVSSMNIKAQELGMRATKYANANGLPNAAQITTALDTAILATSLVDRFAKYYPRFQTKTFKFGDRTVNTHNNFLAAFRGATGLKTGFTCKAGYNLVATAHRDGRRLLGVVLGGATAAARDARMVRIMRSGFSDGGHAAYAMSDLSMSNEQGGATQINNSAIADGCINPQGSKTYSTVKGWSIELGVEVERSVAIRRAKAFIKQQRALLKGGEPLLTPQWARNTIYRVGVTGLKRENATKTCLTVRAQVHCLVRTPKAANYAMERAQRVLDAIARRAKREPVQ